MSQVEAELPTKTEALRQRTLVRQNSEEFKIFTEDAIVVREEDNSFSSQPVSKSSDMAIPGFMIVVSLIQVCTYYLSGPFFFLYLGYDPCRRHQVWRFLTVMFVHSSGSHLWGNVISQLTFGVLLEISYNWKRIVIIYMAGVLGGTLFISFFTPDIEYSRGASGGIFALIFAQVATILLTWNDTDKSCQLFWLFLAESAYEDGLSLSGVYGELVLGNYSKTSYTGHLGGALAGFLIAIFVLKDFVDHPWEKTLKKMCATILLNLTLHIVFTNIAYPNLYPQPEFNTDYVETFFQRLFKMIDESSKPSDDPFLVNCLKEKLCAYYWTHYKITGEVTYFVDLVKTLKL